jgi:hypothetical protein
MVGSHEDVTQYPASVPRTGFRQGCHPMEESQGNAVSCSILPQRAYRRGHVQSREPADAVRGEPLADLEDVLLHNRKTTFSVACHFYY